MAASLHISGGTVVTADELIEADVVMRGTDIRAVGSLEVVGAEVRIDASELFVAPGYIDTQVNGGFGISLSTNPEALWDLGRLLPQHGVTAFLPTLVTSQPEAAELLLKALGERPDGYVGAEPLGAHFEGPMLSAERLGAHDQQHRKAANSSVIAGWTKPNGVAMVTLAPELPGAHEIIAELVACGVVVAAGHSEATAAEALAGFDAGITAVTHLFNAMSGLGHRSPGLVGATLANSDVIAGIIVDRVHVDPIAVQVAWKAKGDRRIMLVTDAVAAMGSEPGTYRLGDSEVKSDGISVRTADGTLAGSLLTMDQAVRNLHEITDCSAAAAVASASAVPAQLLGDQRRGTIRAGARADFVLLDDDVNVQITVCGGEVVYVAEGAEHLVIRR